ncbi:hypothetical protein HID58_041589, partial [Brassica napus]
SLYKPRQSVISSTKAKQKQQEREKLATSGTYVTEVPLNGTAEKYYKRWKSENHLFPDAVGHHIQSVTVHDGDWDSHGDGKQEIFKEKREIDVENKSVTVRGLEGHVMEQLKVYGLIFQFIPKSEDGCICKITMIWEKRNDDFPEPSDYMRLLKSLVVDMEDHREMATSGTYVTEVPLKGNAEKHYRRWRNENHVFPDAIGHHIQGVTIHDGEWDSHGAIKTWNYTCDGKPEVFKERREIDDEKKAVTFRGLEGHVMEQLKVYDVVFEFIPQSEDGCVCKITMIWEKRNDDFPEPSNYMKFVKSMAADMDHHVIKA